MIEKKFCHQEKNVGQTSCTWKASFAELKKHPTFSKYLVKLVRQKGFRLVYFTVQFNYTLTQPTYLDSLACYYSFLFSFPHTKWFSVLHSRCYALATWAVAMISIDSINSTSSQGRSIIDSFISRLQGCMLRRLSMPNQLSAMGCQLGRWVGTWNFVSTASDTSLHHTNERLNVAAICTFTVNWFSRLYL